MSTMKELYLKVAADESLQAKVNKILEAAGEDADAAGKSLVEFAKDQYSVMMPHDPSTSRQPWWHYNTSQYKYVATEMDDKEFCYNCGEYQERAWRYCPFCGTKIGY